MIAPDITLKPKSHPPPNPGIGPGTILEIGSIRSGHVGIFLVTILGDRDQLRKWMDMAYADRDAGTEEAIYYH